MTKAEKKMKKYCNAVERKLNLPREVKRRVMSDFISSISARREAGLSDEEICAELGTPTKAAAELNEQMKEFTYRKSPWRFLFLAAAVYGGYELIGTLWGAFLYLLFRIQSQAFAVESQGASVGIIGGADGPTAIFVTYPGWIYYLVPVLCLILGIWGYLRLRKCRK